MKIALNKDRNPLKIALKKDRNPLKIALKKDRNPLKRVPIIIESSLKKRKETP